VFAEECKVNQESAQQICHHEGNTGHPKIVQQGYRTQ